MAYWFAFEALLILGALLQFGPPATVRVRHGELVVDPRGLNKVYALAWRKRIPLSQVRRVTLGADTVPWRPTIRVRGASLGSLRAGVFGLDHQRSFWVMRKRETALVIWLAGSEYDYVVVNVRAPDALADAIRQALLNSPAQ